MKTIILIMSALLSSTYFLNAQESQEKKNNGENKELQELLKKFNQQKDELHVVPDLRNRDLINEFSRKFNDDSTFTEHFPGASTYYAKRPVYTPYSKFIIEPDTSAKYYLIVADPLRNTVTR